MHIRSQRLASPTSWLSVVAVGLLVGFSIQFARAWVDPTTPPPGGNVAGPVTTGSATQSKDGSLNIYGNLAVAPNPTTGLGGNLLLAGTNSWLLHTPEASTTAYLRHWDGTAWDAANGFSFQDNGQFNAKIVRATDDIRVGTHSLNSNTDEWLRLGDQNGNYYAGKGFAAEKLYSSSVLYANGNLCLNGDCRTKWPLSGPVEVNRTRGMCNAANVGRSIIAPVLSNDLRDARLNVCIVANDFAKPGSSCGITIVSPKCADEDFGYAWVTTPSTLIPLP